MTNIQCERCLKSKCFVNEECDNANDISIKIKINININIELMCLC